MMPLVADLPAAFGVERRIGQDHLYRLPLDRVADPAHCPPAGRR